MYVSHIYIERHESHHEVGCLHTIFTPSTLANTYSGTES